MNFCLMQPINVDFETEIYVFAVDLTTVGSTRNNERKQAAQRHAVLCINKRCGDRSTYARNTPKSHLVGKSGISQQPRN